MGACLAQRGQRRFCPGTGGWQLFASSFPTKGPGFSRVYHSGHLYGTFSYVVPFMQGVQSLNVSTGQWEVLPPPPATKNWYATLCVMDSRLHVFGGGTAFVEEYVAPQRRWVSVPGMPRAVYGAAAVALEGKPLGIGGINSEVGVLRAILEYDPGVAGGRGCPACSRRDSIAPLRRSIVSPPPPDNKG